jgi:hypothetical protein
MSKPEDLTLDQLLYNAVLYLVQAGQQAAAELLVECELESFEDDGDPIYGFDHEVVDYDPYTRVLLLAPHVIQHILTSDTDVKRETSTRTYYTNFRRNEIAAAFQAILRRSEVKLAIHVQLIADTESDWREHLRQVAKGQKVTNQGRLREQNDPVIVWKSLIFRSKAEKVIAEALDRAGVMFFPNCAARLGPTEHRHNKEPDFLICCDGKWGILEVDGKALHQEAAQDHERDRQFRQQGIKVIEHFSGRRCLEEPDEVVQTFIRILQQNG